MKFINFLKSYQFPLSTNGKKIVDNYIYYEVVKSDTKEKVTLKTPITKDHRKFLIKEYSLLKSISKHKNIVDVTKCFKISFKKKSQHFTELSIDCSNTLSDYFGSSELTLYQKNRVLNGLIAGITHLHNASVIIGDINKYNVLMSKNGRDLIPIISNLNGPNQSNRRQVLLNKYLNYRSPEFLKYGIASYQSDLWSLALIMFELYGNKCPIMILGGNQLKEKNIQKLINSTLTFSESKMPLEIKNAICLMLNKDRLRKDLNIKVIHETLKKYFSNSNSSLKSRNKKW